MKRVAIFYLTDAGNGGMPIAMPGDIGFCYIRVEVIDPERLEKAKVEEGTSDDLEAALAIATPQKGESVMNSHYIHTPR